MTQVLLVPDSLSFADDPEAIATLVLGTQMIVIVGPELELNKIRTVGDCDNCDPSKVVRYDPEVHGE